MEQATKMTIHLQWQGLQGTLCFNMLPYGVHTEDATELPTAEPTHESTEVPAEDVTEAPAEGPTEEEPTVPDRVIDTTLEQVKISDTIHNLRPLVCVKLNLQTGSDFNILLSVGVNPLKMVRWSMDGGKTYSLLYDSAQLSFAYPYPEGWDGTVLLDMSQALTADVRPTISVEATGYSRYECTPVVHALPILEDPVVETAELPQILQISTRWGAAQMQLQRIERLTTDEEGNLVYVEDNAFKASITSGGIRMESAQADILPASGSYRFKVIWLWDGVILDEQTIDFFVNTN